LTELTRLLGNFVPMAGISYKNGKDYLFGNGGETFTGSILRVFWAKRVEKYKFGFQKLNG